MIRHPPRSPPFPYPTLSQSQRFRPQKAHRRNHLRPIQTRPTPAKVPHPHGRRCGCKITVPLEPLFSHNRSLGRLDRKEHTSELQSPCNLVCRLLLEKKKSSH